MAEEVYWSFETGGDDWLELGDLSNKDYWQAIRFTTAQAITCTSASIYLPGVINDPDGDMTFKIETDVGNEPSGTLAHANATGVIPFADIFPVGWNKASFTKFALPAGTYWLVVNIPDQPRNHYYYILADTDGVGVVADSINHGSTWSVYVNNLIIYTRIYREIVVEESKFRDNICFKGLPGGFSVRGQINKEFIYAVKNRQQRKYAYFIPTNPQTETQQAWRAVFTAAVAAAAALSEAAKDEWREVAYRKKGQTWRSCFLTWYLWKEAHS